VHYHLTYAYGYNVLVILLQRTLRENLTLMQLTFKIEMRSAVL